jgi:hypothetical protein
LRGSNDDAIVQLGNSRVVTRVPVRDQLSSAQPAKGDLVEMGLRATAFGRTSVTMQAGVRNMVPPLVDPQHRHDRVRQP